MEKQELSLMEKMTYQNIFEKLKNRDSSLTEEQFCLEYLNRSYHYTSMCKATSVNISESALLALYRNLKGLAVLWHDIAVESSMASSTRTWQNYLFYKSLSEVVWRDVAEVAAR